MKYTGLLAAIAIGIGLTACESIDAVEPYLPRIEDISVSEFPMSVTVTATFSPRAWEDAATDKAFAFMHRQRNDDPVPETVRGPDATIYVFTDDDCVSVGTGWAQRCETVVETAGTIFYQFHYERIGGDTISAPEPVGEVLVPPGG